ncbi:protodermal factor 1 [Diospyros lotus]|uniref:protodermal factor 1 n=1 Tax=Diospyros lotus TaxID=55363 RepID=UPI00225A37AD|nr:protodermal factor 1 [Diospyros lotus]
MAREKRNKQTSPLFWSLIAGLLSQSLLIPVMSITSLQDQKNYYTPDPNAGSPPTGSHGSPPHHSGGSYGGSPPYHGTPSHGGSHGGSPPSNCGNPPSGHHDPTPAPPTGGGYYNPTPAPPTGGGYNPTPAPPTGGGYNPTPAPPTGGGVPFTPVIGTPPVTLTPPTTPIDPGTPSIPGISIPSPPFSFDPNSPPFSCNYWRTHPGLVWGLLGWFGTVGGTFGVTSLPGIGTNLSLQQALSNAHTEGYEALYREGTASLLNSMVDNRFPFTSKQIRENFIRAISSNKAATAQARLFKLANEGRLKPRA